MQTPGDMVAVVPLTAEEDTLLQVMVATAVLRMRRRRRKDMEPSMDRTVRNHLVN